MRHEDPEASQAAVLLKGVAFEAMVGQSVHYGPDFIDALSEFIDHGVQRIGRENLNVFEGIPVAAENLTKFMWELVDHTAKLEQSEVDLSMFEGAKMRFCPKWPFC